MSHTLRMGHVRSAICSALVLTLLLVQGCSFLMPSRQTVDITTNQTTAEIWVDGKFFGTNSTVYETELIKDKDHWIEARIGDKVSRAEIKRGLSFTAVIDIVVGFLFPLTFLGVFAPGFWWLKPSSVNVPLPDSAVAEAEAAKKRKTEQGSRPGRALEMPMEDN